MQENYFIKRQRDLKESKANESAKTGHAKRALRESMDPTALEGDLRKALNNPSIEHCGDAYDEDGNEVMMFGDSSKGTAEAIAKYLKGKGFANASIDKDDGAARGDGTAWFAVVRQDSKPREHTLCKSQHTKRRQKNESLRLNEENPRGPMCPTCGYNRPNKTKDNSYHCPKCNTVFSMKSGPFPKNIFFCFKHGYWEDYFYNIAKEAEAEDAELSFDKNPTDCVEWIVKKLSKEAKDLGSQFGVSINVYFDGVAWGQGDIEARTIPEKAYLNIQLSKIPNYRTLVDLKSYCLDADDNDVAQFMGSAFDAADEGAFTQSQDVSIYCDGMFFETEIE